MKKKDLNDNSALVGMTDLSLAVTLTKPVNPLGFSFLIFQIEIIIASLPGSQGHYDYQMRQWAEKL